MSARPAPQRFNPSELIDPMTSPLLYMFRSTALFVKTSKFKDILNDIYSLFGRCLVSDVPDRRLKDLNHICPHSLCDCPSDQ